MPTIAVLCVCKKPQSVQSASLSNENNMVRTLSSACRLPHWDQGSPSSSVPAFLLACPRSICFASPTPLAPAGSRRGRRPGVCVRRARALCSMLTDPSAGRHTGTRAQPPCASLQFCLRCPRSICFSTSSSYPMSPKRWGAPRLRGGRGRVPGAGGVSVCAKRVCAHQPR